MSMQMETLLHLSYFSKEKSDAIVRNIYISIMAVVYRNFPKDLKITIRKWILTQGWEENNILPFWFTTVKRIYPIWCSLCSH